MDIPATQVRVQVRFGQALMNSSLIGAERAAALQEQSNAVEWWPPGGNSRPRRSCFGLTATFIWICPYLVRWNLWRGPSLHGPAVTHDNRLAGKGV